MTKIKNLKKGDYVLSFNVLNGKYEYKKVLATVDQGIKEVSKFSLEDGTSITCTPDHKILSEEAIYAPIRTQAEVCTTHGKVAITDETPLGAKRVFDITVADNHNFVLANGAIVKNCGAQTPFSSINYGTGTTPEQRLVIKSVLEATDAGMGSGETPIFPVQVFKVLDGTNTKKGDINYDLFQLACKVSAKRLFPNFVFLDAPYNKKYYKEGHPETEAAVMGCFAPGHIIKVINIKTFEVISVNIERFVEEYNYKKYRVWDSFEGAFVKILNVINNPETWNFYKVTYRIGKNKGTAIVTEDHFFPVVYKGRTNVKNLMKGDYLFGSHFGKKKHLKIIKVEKLGTTFGSKSYCLETSSDHFDVDNTFVSNNCRTRVLPNIYDPEHQTPVGRGNIAFTTINLPKIALLSDKDLDIFFNKLDKTLKLCYNNLYDRFKYLSKKHAYNYPFLLSEGVWLDSEKLQPEDTIEEVLKQGTLAIGFCGLAECLVALIGKHHGESEEAQQLGLKIVGRIKSFCDQASQDTGLTWGAFASPAESAAGRFARINRKEFGLIKGVTDRDYITNSAHIPVYYPISAAKKIELEAPYHELCSAGAIAYVECNGDLTKNPEAFENIILYMKDKGVCYGSINHPVDRCPVCGYVGIINDICPKCGRKDGEEVTIEHLRKIGCNCY